MLDAYDGAGVFCSPEVCFVEARRHIPGLYRKRNANFASALVSLDRIESLIEVVDFTAYEEYERRARARIDSRDPNDWPILATALLLDCPIWTEDRDFFGTGVATWTSDKVELYLRPA